VLGSGVLTALLFAALGSYAVWQSRQQYEQRAELLTQNLATVVASNLNANVDKIDLALEAVVTRLEEDLADGRLDLAYEAHHLLAQTVYRPELEGIRVTDAQGIAILGPKLPKNSHLDFSDREWFMAQRDRPDRGLYISAPLLSKVNQQWILSFSRRYRGPDGRFAGAVSAAVPLDYFERLLSSAHAGARGTVVLRDTNLRLVARYPLLPGPAGTPGNTRVSPELQARVQRPDWQSTTYHTAAPADGVPRTYTAQRVARWPLLVIVGAAPEDYLADWTRERNVVVGVSLAVLLLYGGACMLLLRLLAQNRAARQRIDLLAKVFDSSGEAILVTDHANRIVEVNPAFTRQTGYLPEEVIGQDPRLLASGRTTPEEYQALWQAVQQRGEWRGELWDRAKDGQIYPKWMSIAVLRDEDGAVAHHIASFIDMSEVKQAEEKILHLAHHDTLTRLPNRVHLQGRLEQAMARARRDSSELAMLFIDLDHFKHINDTLGHHVGDDLLVEVAQRLKALVRDSDIVARLGGDEFVLVLTALNGDGSRAAAAVARKVIAALSECYSVRGHALHATPSIGISLFPADGSDADTLMRNADTAMYHAKSTGRNNYQFYTASMNLMSAERLTLEQALRGAVDRGELCLHYQPQVRVATGQVVGVEALARWRHPVLGEVPPLKFIPIAEEAGLIGRIGEWVLHEALAQVARWRADGLPTLRVAVNLSAHQLRDERFTEHVAQALQAQGLGGEALELEITESAAMRDPARTAGLLRQLRALGVALAIDDFGTGYSSLAYLKQLPLSSLKLDRSFVMDIEHDPNDAAISAATITLAHSLGLAVVAEGVENAAQLDFLRGLGCDMVQGYHFSRPLPAEACGAFMRQHEDAAGRAATTALAAD